MFSKLNEYVACQFRFASLHRLRMKNKIIDDVLAFDLDACPVSITYLRQSLRRAGFRTIKAGVKWLLVFNKKED